MHDISATCPLCRAANQYGAELIGRYTLCPNCRNRFYIEVPPLGGEERKPVLASERVAVSGLVPATTLDDLLWDTQRGSRFIIESLRRQEARLQRLSWETAAALVLLLLGLAVTILR